MHRQASALITNIRLGYKGSPGWNARFCLASFVCDESKKFYNIDCRKIREDGEHKQILDYIFHSSERLQVTALLPQNPYWKGRISTFDLHVPY